MTRTHDIFARLKAAGEKAFVPYLTCGDPNLARTAELLLVLEDAGAHVIELGVPFSDPLADGPTIQAASQRALAAGTTLSKILDLVGRMRDRLDAALTIFSYYNPVFRYGLERFCADAKDAGVDAVLIPDLTPEEAAPLIASARPRDLDTVFLIAPTSTERRIRKAADVSSAFVYAVSLTGVTGVRDTLPDDLGEFIGRAKGILNDKPVVVGFGISTREQARQVAGLADGAVVGSAIMKVIESAGDSPRLAADVGALARDLAAGVAEAGKRRD